MHVHLYSSKHHDWKELITTSELAKKNFEIGQARNAEDLNTVKHRPGRMEQGRYLTRQHQLMIYSFDLSQNSFYFFLMSNWLPQTCAPLLLAHTSAVIISNKFHWEYSTYKGRGYNTGPQIQPKQINHVFNYQTSFLMVKQLNSSISSPKKNEII